MVTVRCKVLLDARFRSYSVVRTASNVAGVITGGRCSLRSSRSLSPETMKSVS